MEEHKKGEHIKWEERLKIQGALRTGAKPAEIAKMIGCCREAKGETIESRPAEVKERKTFGHWEMDSVMGCKGSKAALVVLTERLTRCGRIFRVADHTMASVVKVLDKLERKMGKNFREVLLPNKNIGNLVVMKESGYLIRRML